MLEQLIARIFATRDAAHILHWRTVGPGSYSAHMALGGFYDAIVEKLDHIVEASQGRATLIGEVASTPVRWPDRAAAINHLMNEVGWIEANRSAIAGGSPAIENMVDDLSGTYWGALYKLRNLQ